MYNLIMSPYTLRKEILDTPLSSINTSKLFVLWDCSEEKTSFASYPGEQQEFSLLPIQSTRPAFGVFERCICFLPTIIKQAGISPYTMVQCKWLTKSKQKLKMEKISEAGTFRRARPSMEFHIEELWLVDS